MGNIVTNPNSQLDPERLNGVEGGALLTQGGLSFRATAFYNQLDGAVANVTVSTPTLSRDSRQLGRNSRQGSRARGRPAPAPDGYRQRADHVHLQPLPRIEATPALAGNRVPQVPGVQFGAGVTWTPEWLTVAAQVRGSSSQFDDDLNTPEFELNPFAVLDLSLSRRSPARCRRFCRPRTSSTRTTTPAERRFARSAGRERFGLAYGWRFPSLD